MQGTWAKNGRGGERRQISQMMWRQKGEENVETWEPAILNYRLQKRGTDPASPLFWLGGLSGLVAGEHAIIPLVGWRWKKTREV